MNLNVEPYVTDGTIAGTSLISDLAPGAGGSTPIFLGIIDSKAIFSSQSLGIYKSDGTAAGTTLVTQPNFSWHASKPVTLGNKIIFLGQTAAAGIELWVTDGTAPGTFMLKDIATGNNSGVQEIFGKDPTETFIYFRGSDFTNGIELWKTDGTTAGTVLIADQCSGTCSTYFANMVEFKGKTYFTKQVDNPDTLNQTQSQIWTTDGTSAGTVLFADVRPKVITGMYSNSNSIFLLMKSSTTDDRILIYRYKPSVSTQFSIYPGLDGMNPIFINKYDDKLFFTDTSPINLQRSFFWIK